MDNLFLGCSDDRYLLDCGQSQGSHTLARYDYSRSHRNISISFRRCRHSWLLFGQSAIVDDLFSRWLVGLFVIACLLAVWCLASRGMVNGVHPGLAHWFEIIGLLSLFGFLNGELVRLSWDWAFPVTLAAFSILWTLFAASLLVTGFFRKRKFYRMCAIVLL